jgi:hypothetical protein
MDTRRDLQVLEGVDVDPESSPPSLSGQVRRSDRANRVELSIAHTGARCPTTVLLGSSSLACAGVIVEILAMLGIGAHPDVGQQGMPATVWVDLTGGRRGCVAVLLALAELVDPSSRRLRTRFLRQSSIRVSTTRRALASTVCHDSERAG